MQHPQPTPPAYYSELATLLADDAEPLPTDILDFIDELELHDCAGSAERRAGAPGSTSCAPEAQPAGKAQREPEGTSPDRATDTGNASRIKRLRQRNREAQARFRLKQKVHNVVHEFIVSSHHTALLCHLIMRVRRRVAQWHCCRLHIRSPVLTVADRVCN